MSLSQRSAFDRIRTMPRYFWLLAVVFTLTFGILFLDHFRTYSSQITILVIHKNEKTAVSADQVVHTVAELPKTLAFYNRLVKQFPEVSDPWIGLSDGERERLWSERVFTERVDGSGLIHVRISADTALDASLLAQKSATNLFQVIGQYYDIRTELDIRTVESPLTNVKVSDPVGWILVSLIFGFFTAAIVSSGMTMFACGVGRIRIREFFGANKDLTKTALLPVTFETTLQEEIPTQKELTHRTHEQNLPFLEDGISLEEHLFGVQDVPEDKSPEDADSTPVASEPTPEELKRRLNQLLKGDME